MQRECEGGSERERERIGGQKRKRGAQREGGDSREREKGGR